LVNAQNNIPEQASDILQPEQSDKLPVSLLPMDSGQLSEKTNAAIKASIAAYTGDDITLVLAQSYNMDPGVGWLVCIEGDERGRDICLHSGQNFFGCKEDKTLLVASDAQSAPENHGAIVYDPKHNQFFIIANSAGEVKLNGEALSGSSQLKDADRIEVAGARYIFAALCKESFRWE
jgi:hypothetical protein